MPNESMSQKAGMTVFIIRMNVVFNSKVINCPYNCAAFTVLNLTVKDRNYPVCSGPEITADKMPF